MDNLNDIKINYKHNGFLKTFMWHRKLKYWVCIKSPNGRDNILWQEAPCEVGKELTYLALEMEVLTKSDLNIYGVKKIAKKERKPSKPKNFIPLF